MRKKIPFLLCWLSLLHHPNQYTNEHARRVDAEGTLKDLVPVILNAF